MWLITTQGFYSVVAHRDDPGRLLVRARVRGDLEALRAQIPGIELIETPDADYRWRAFVTRDEWRSAVADLAESIDYDIFKEAVARRGDSRRERTYFSVWVALAQLQEP